MISVADKWKIRLYMTTQTQVRVPGNQHLVRDRTMHLVAGGASIAQGLVFLHKRSALVFMTLEAGFIRIFHARCRPGPRVNAVEVMTIGAAHLAL